MTLLFVFFVTFGLSYFFALAGLGAATLLVPIFFWNGMPLNTAKSAALLANTLSLSAATLDNLRSRRIDMKLGAPIILFSFLFAPVGVYLSTFFSKEAILWLFTAFLIFAGINALVPRKTREDGDEHPRIFVLVAIGALTGLFSGLLGIGGGGIISASMLWLGYNAKKVAVITALAVPFSSFSGFMTYAAEGYISWPLLATVGIAALLGGLAGNKTMHAAVPERFVRYAIATVSLSFAAKIIVDMIV